MNQFHYTGYAQEIIFGSGSLLHVSEAIERFHWQRLMLCTSGSLRRDGTIAALEGVLGNRLVAIYEQVQPHVPDFQVAEALAIATRHEVDALIGLGGGSPIGMAKAVGARFIMPFRLPNNLEPQARTQFVGSRNTGTAPRDEDGQIVRKTHPPDPRAH
jgi:maleylacetate reductase